MVYSYKNITSAVLVRTLITSRWFLFVFIVLELLLSLSGIQFCTTMKTPHAESSSIVPRDLVMDILSLLPVKPLVRFTCVSKSWKSLIFDPTFVKLQLQRSPKTPQLLLTIEDVIRDFRENRNRIAVPCTLRRSVEHQTFTINEEICYPLKNHYWVIGSCNGLVCLLGTHRYKNDINEYWVRFWNPAMMFKSNKSPLLEVKDRSQRLGVWYNVNIGYGYDDSQDTYKVVAVLWDYVTEKIEVRVHHMGDDRWRKITGCSAFPVLLGQMDGKFVNGSINWLALDRLDCHDYNWDSVTVNELVIFSLDLRKETYRYLFMPRGFGEIPYIEPEVTVLGGFLCLFHDHRRSHFVVWQMREFGFKESWTPLLNVTYDHLQCLFDTYYLLIPICLSENGDLLLVSDFDDFEVIIYNRRDNSVEHKKIPENKSWVNACDYVQSLVLPH